MRDVEEQNVQINAGMFTLNEDGELVIDSESLREVVASAAEHMPDPLPCTNKAIYIW